MFRRRLSGTVSERSRSGLGARPTVMATRRFRKVCVAWQAQHVAGAARTLARSGAGAALSDGQVQVSWQAQNFRKVGYRIRGSTEFVASAALSQNERMRENMRGRVAGEYKSRKRVTLCVFWRVCVDVDHLCLDACLARSRNRSRRSAHCNGNAQVSQGLCCVAGAALSQGRVQISWQAQHVGKVRCRFRGRRSTLPRSGADFVAFERSGADFVAGAALSQGWVQNSWQAQHFRSGG